MLAESVRSHIGDMADVEIWDQNDFFELGKGTLQNLLDELPKFDFAVFVLGPDDEITYRGTPAKAPRGNIVFELGLFMGKFGSKRVFGIFSDQKDLLVPSDFFGVTIVRYRSEGLDVSRLRSCEAATAEACARIRREILRYEPPPRGFIITPRTVRSITTYLSSRQDDIRIAVDKNPIEALAQFDRECHAAMIHFPIYDSIKDALGTHFGLYVQAIGAAPEKPAEMRYLNCCIRPSAEPGSTTYLEAILEDDMPEEGFLEHDIVEEIKVKAFGHWLLSKALAPVPLAVVIDCSVKPQWDAQIMVVHETPLVFRIDASGTSEDFVPALEKFRSGRVAFEGLNNRFKSLKTMLSDEKAKYMGRTIKSVLFIPVHGWPNITLQILTRERLRIDTEMPEMIREPGGGDLPIRLTVDELMSIRLCGQQLQGLLANRVRPIPKSTAGPG